MGLDKAIDDLLAEIAHLRGERDELKDKLEAVRAELHYMKKKQAEPAKETGDGM